LDAAPVEKKMSPQPLRSTSAGGNPGYLARHAKASPRAGGAKPQQQRQRQHRPPDLLPDALDAMLDAAPPNAGRAPASNMFNDDSMPSSRASSPGGGGLGMGDTSEFEEAELRAQRLVGGGGKKEEAGVQNLKAKNKVKLNYKPYTRECPSLSSIL
jgi:hypothetical protein